MAVYWRREKLLAFLLQLFLLLLLLLLLLVPMHGCAINFHTLTD
jgi:hypothetical protein